MKQELILINGNNQEYKQKLPKLSFLCKFINDVALKHITANTGLMLKKEFYGYSAQPKTFEQIVALFLTYNYKTQYHDNATNHNNLYLKSCHDDGFKVDSLCFDCCKENRIHTRDMKKTDRLGV